MRHLKTAYGNKGELPVRCQKAGFLRFLELWLIAFILAMILQGCSRPGNGRIDLAGEWRFAADSLDRGIPGKWYSKRLEDHVMLPGSMNSNGKGDPVGMQTRWTGNIWDSSFFVKPEYEKYRQAGNFKVPFWLQPLKHYQGAAWYQKEVRIPRAWENMAISLSLERCHWETRLWIDGREVGMRNSLGTAHVYDLTGILGPGKHRLTVCVDNRIKDIDPGVNSHSVSDHTQTNWNGMVGDMFLEARPQVHIRSVKIWPDIEKKSIMVQFRILNLTEEEVKADITMQATGATNPAIQSLERDLKTGENDLEIEYFMGEDARLWDEFSPELYTLRASVKGGTAGTTDSVSAVFGMRSFGVEDGRITVNGRPVFLRGTLECAIFPETGYPSTSVGDWSRIFSICRAHGLNHMRFHSWCPPEAAFIAADRAGFYLQVECSSWANQSTTLGDGKPFDRYLYEESERMVESYGNHPSFCMMAYGNEPGGRKQVSFLTEFVSYWKGKDNRRIYTSGAGWPNLPVNDYLSDSEPRIQHWGAGLASIINSKPPSTDYDWTYYMDRISQPVVSHEIGQWCVYPNFREIDKYDGVLRARNFEIFRSTLEEHGMGQLADTFLMASGKLQAICYKADIEAALRTRGFGGFQLLDLHDFPGQGTALVGVLDAFWDEKGYIPPREFKRFCNSTVPLARMEKLIYTSNETFRALVEVAHYGPTALASPSAGWSISGSSGDVLASGRLEASGDYHLSGESQPSGSSRSTDIPTGGITSLGKVELPLEALKVPQKLILEVYVEDYINAWNFWVYPTANEKIENEKSLLVIQKPGRDDLEFLEQGGSILLNLGKGTLSRAMGGDIAVGFSSIFWNTAWTNRQAPHTLGILCDPAHPALAGFPTEFHSNWQWWDAMSNSGAIDISSFPGEMEPIVRVIDDWFTNRPLALVFEARVGKGKLLVSGIDLQTGLGGRPAARQMLYSLKKYMAGPNFNPDVELTVEQVRGLFED